MAELCAALGALGHQVELASTTLDGPYDLCVPTGVAAEEDGFSAIVFPVAHPRGYTFSPSLSRWLWRNIGRFDIVHVHGIYLFVTLAVARICRARGVPYVMHPHGALTAYHRAHNSGRKRVYELALERSHARHAATLIWESERERAEAVDAGWPEGSVVWSGVHVPTLDPDAVRRRGEIVFLGRVSAKKGVDTLVEAFARVVAVRSDARLRIIGPDEDGRSRALARRAAELGIADHIAFEGIALGEQKDDALRRAWLHVLPSADESFGAAAVEALAYATPVVLTRAFPFADELERGGGCVLVDREPASVADGMLRLLVDEQWARRAGRNGRSFVAERFSWSVIARQLAEVYGNAVGASRSAGAQSVGRAALSDGTRHD